MKSEGERILEKIEKRIAECHCLIAKKKVEIKQLKKVIDTIKKLDYQEDTA
jgi:hypothetical protein